MERMGKSIPFGWWLALLVLLALTAHWRALPFSFFSDDFSVIHKLGAREDLSPGTFFRPLPDWTLWLQYRLHGPDSWAFRFVNVLLLGVNGWLVAVLTKKLMRPDAAVLAGALFVLYPFHLEPQVWIIARSTAMATSFILLALVVATGEALGIKKTIGVGLLGFLGSLCYESALLLPLLLSAWWFVLRPADSCAWRGMVLISAGAVAMNLVLRSILIERVANDYGAAFFTKDLLSYPAMMLKVVGRSFLPPHETPAVQTVRFALLGIVWAAAAAWFRFTAKKDADQRRRGLLLIALFGIASSIAVVGGVSTRTSESDRFLYLPSAFVCMGLALAMERITSVAIRRTMLVALIVVSGWLLREGLSNWQVASSTIAAIIEGSPSPPENGRLFVSGLPQEYQGAFIFRHGYQEALAISGKEVEHVGVVVEDLGARVVIDTGDTLTIEPGDQRYDASLATTQKP